MESSRAHATILPLQRSRALEILRHESSRYAIGRWGRFVYRALRVMVSGFTLSFLLMIALPLAAGGRRVERELLSATIVAMGLAAGICLLFAVVLLLLNAPSIVKMTRQRFRTWRLGLGDASVALWRGRTKGSLLSRVWDGVVLAVAALFVTAVLLSFPSRTGLAMASFVAIPVLGQHFLRRARERHDLLADVDRLAAALGPEGVSPVDVSRDVLEVIARVEAAQIARDRIAAVTAESTSPRSWAVAPTRGFSAARSRLSPQRQAEVQDLIERLSADPRAEPAQEDADAVWRARTDGGEELRFAIDDDRRQLRLMSLGRAEASATLREARS